jgi:hypothetical protein
LTLSRPRPRGVKRPSPEQRGPAQVTPHAALAKLASVAPAPAAALRGEKQKAALAKAAPEEEVAGL